MISSHFGHCQESWYRSQVKSSSFSGIIWMKKVTVLLWEKYQTLWKERCRIVNEENVASTERRYRDELWKYHQNLQAQSHYFSSDERDGTKYPK